MQRGWVALRKESVDRNNIAKILSVETVTSLSARRAWIEIAGEQFQATLIASLSARRAWIEILNGEILNALA